MKRVLSFLIAICTVFLLMLPSPVSSAEVKNSTLLQVVPLSLEHLQGQDALIAVSFQGDIQARLAACRLRVEYEESRLTLKRIQTSSAVSSGDFRYAMHTSSAIGIYASAGDGIPLNGEFVTLVFEVNEDAPPGAANVTVTVDQLITATQQRLPEPSEQSVQLTITEPVSYPALLTSLIPSAGQLEPGFSPEHTEYEMTVPYEVSSLTFDAEPASQATFRVNRKNLNRAGIPTVFVVTVTSADGKLKKQYSVTVHRLEKEKDPVSSQESSSAPASKPQSSSAAASSRTSHAVPVQTVSSSPPSPSSVSSKTPSSQASSSKVSSPKASSSRTASSKSSFSQSSAVSKTGASQPARQASSPGTSDPMVYGNHYLFQNTNRMSGFLLGIICGCVGLIVGVLLALVVVLKRKHPKEKKGP